MITKEIIIDILKSQKPQLSKFGVNNIGLFGSYLTNEQDFDPQKESFDNYMAVYDILENIFGNNRIEVVTRNGLSPHIGPKILKDVMYV